MFELPTYFILPLCRVNFRDFGKLTEDKWNLKLTKLNVETKEVKVQVHFKARVPTNVYQVETFLREESEGRILVFKLPESIDVTIKKFRQGKYSEFPNSIKAYIQSYSGLHKQDRRILGLWKSSVLKKELEKELEVVLADDAELLEAPKPEWFLREKEEV